MAKEQKYKDDLASSAWSLTTVPHMLPAQPVDYHPTLEFCFKRETKINASEIFEILLAALGNLHCTYTHVTLLLML